MRGSAALTARVALARPSATAAAIPDAVLQAKSASVVSSMEYRCGLGIVRQRKAIDQRGVTQNQTKMDGDAAMPGRTKRQAECPRVRRDQGVGGMGLFRFGGCTARARWLEASLGAARLRLAARFSFHAFGTSKNSSAKWQA